MKVRSNQNWIALGFAFVYLICFLFLPFYRIVVVGMNGILLMQYGYSIMYVPLVLALAMAFASVVLDPKISMGVGAASFVVTLVFLIAGRDILLGGNAITSLANNVITQSVGANVSAFIPVSAGVGCILCLVVTVGFVAVEILLNQGSKPKPTLVEDPLSEDFF